MTLQEIAASIAMLQGKKHQAALGNKPGECFEYQAAIELLEDFAEKTRREIMILKEYRKYTAYCDICCDSLPPCESWDDAKDSMRDEGWTTVRTDNGWENYCPYCKHEIGGET